MKIAIAQINPTVGDLSGNTRLIRETLKTAESQASDLVIFPELSIPGYPPEDLIFKPTFITDNLAALKSIASLFKKTAGVIGFIDRTRAGLFNAAAWLENGRVQEIYHKHHLPNYGVFDERRYFTAGDQYVIRKFKGFRCALSICEDMWVPELFLPSLKKKKPDLLINISASPFHAEKISVRTAVAKKVAQAMRVPVLYANLVGGQDELVFDGGSFIVNAKGRIVHQSPLFRSTLSVVEFERKKSEVRIRCGERDTVPSRIVQIQQALILGLKDYIGKNGFKKVAIGISGGIDSALVAALAVEALGAGNVVGVTMPSKFNSPATILDADSLARNLGIELLTIPIQEVVNTYLSTLAPVFAGRPTDLTEENLQARVRGTLLMALSNKFGWLVLTTGNKSETSTGYSTLYGDTAGGFAVIKDLLKTTVFELARHINTLAGTDLIPKSILIRPPTAELRANQKDEDSLGRYDELDPVVEGYIERNDSIKNLARKLRLNPAYVEKTITLIDRSEYKRRQAPPGIKITPRSFGRDYRMPITNRYHSK